MSEQTDLVTDANGVWVKLGDRGYTSVIAAGEWVIRSDRIWAPSRVMTHADLGLPDPSDPLVQWLGAQI